MSENPGKVITKYTFSGLFRQAWYKTISPELIVAGFRKVGVCPFDRTTIKAVSLDECRAGVDPTQDADEEQLSHQDEDCNKQLADSAIEDQIGENLDLIHLRSWKRNCSKQDTKMDATFSLTQTMHGCNCII